MLVAHLCFCIHFKLTCVSRYTDGVCFFSNDEILHSLEKKAVNHEGGVSMVKMNSHIASSLAGILLPTDSMTNK